MSQNDERGGPQHGANRRSEQSGIVSTATKLLSQEPRLFLPFLLAGIVSAVLEYLNHIDPIPTGHSKSITDGHIAVEYAGYPSGLRKTEILLEPVLSLRLSYLLWGVGSYLLALGIVTAAAVLVIARVMHIKPTMLSGVHLFTFVLAIDLGHRLIGSISLFQQMNPLIGIPLLIFWFFVFARLFAVPGLIVTGDSISSAVRCSAELTQGYAPRIVGVVLLFGLGNSLFGVIPIAGTVLSMILIGTLHAVAVGLFVTNDRKGRVDPASYRG